MVTDAPYFHATFRHGAFTTDGTTHQLLSRNVPDDTTQPLGGIFVEWRWDGSALTIRNDRFGMHPAYYYADADQVMVSPSIPKLLELGAPADFDDTAIASMLAFSFMCGNDTPFANIRSLGPAATVHWSPGKCSIASDFKLTPAQPISRPAAI